MNLLTTDNNYRSNKDGTTNVLKIPREAVGDLAAIASRTVAELRGDNPALLAFPGDLDAYRSGEEKTKTLRLFSLRHQEGETGSLTTGNVMGFVGRNDTQLTIASRFAKDAEAKRDFFLHHMLHKVFRLNIVNFDVPKDDRDDLYDFLLYLFPSHLLSAMRQGLYKEYRRIEHNDANVKGTIDVARHLRRNIPFAGKIAYNTREYRHDNAVTQLVRHAIEHIKAHPWGLCILRNSSEMSDAVNLIEFHTPAYNRNERRRVINANLTRPVRHPYFTEWRRLQQLCLRILRHDKLTFGADKDKVYGLIFDGAWLWEEYLNVMFREIGFEIKHPRNKTGQGRDYLFEDEQRKGQEIFPDFVKMKDKLTAHFVADAKYKHIDRRCDKSSREDYFQVITYMYRYECNRSCLLFPYDGDNTEGFYRERRFLGNTPDRYLWELGLPIPQAQSDFRQFASAMDDKAIECLRRIVEKMATTKQQP